MTALKPQVMGGSIFLAAYPSLLQDSLFLPCLFQRAGYSLARLPLNKPSLHYQFLLVQIPNLEHFLIISLEPQKTISIFPASLPRVVFLPPPHPPPSHQVRVLLPNTFLSGLTPHFNTFHTSLVSSPHYGPVYGLLTYPLVLPPYFRSFTH